MAMKVYDNCWRPNVTDELRFKLAQLEDKIDHKRDQLAFESEPNYRMLLRQQLDDLYCEAIKLQKELILAQSPSRT